MDFLPVFLNIRDRPCLVVGGGEVAARKVSLLLRAGARVTVIAPDLAPGLQDLSQAGDIKHLARDYAARRDALTDYRLVLVATDDAGVNRAVCGAARAAGVPVNVADR
ncbi:MAG TPA: bifunctional precorrin-2 dehydrogenase/sirohydrochlorin ferrochelatase, partial [Gammaproteobacteria bacterium]|nr:bifunctional precorrin-2 dehydrogenase/sirohydrochlorin ferrochelatase [Gammaproteobacteria bacterium]